MPNYKLTYFNITGLGEPIRFLLSYGEAPFEDVRLSFEEWPKHKPNMPLRQIPVLEIDGQKFHQSKAIERYLAKKFNLYGADSIEAMQIDSVVDSIEDMVKALSTWHWQENPVVKESLKEPAFQKLPLVLDYLNDLAKKNGGYFVNKKASYADVVYAGFQDYLSHVLGHDVNKDHPELKKLVDRVKTNPGLKAYLEKRPKTDI